MIDGRVMFLANQLFCKKYVTKLEYRKTIVSNNFFCKEKMKCIFTKDEQNKNKELYNGIMCFLFVRQNTILRITRKCPRMKTVRRTPLNVSIYVGAAPPASPIWCIVAEILYEQQQITIINNFPQDHFSNLSPVMTSMQVQCIGVSMSGIPN